MASAAAQASTLTNGLICHFTFDNTYNDDSGNGINGTPMGAPLFVPGKIGSGALSVTTLANGQEFDYVTLGYPTLLQFDDTENFSVSFWTSYTNQFDDPPFISNKNWESSSNLGWGIFTQNGGNFRVNVMGDGGGSKESTTATPDIRDGTWHHIVVTFDRSSVVSIYVDGQLVHTDPLSGTTGDIDTLSEGYAVNIGQDGTGGYNDSGSAQMVGLLIDDLAIWGRVLFGSEVGAIYQAGLLGSNIMQVTTKLLPSVSSVAPTPGYTGVSGLPTITATIQDADTAVVTSSVVLKLDGTQVPASVNKVTNITTVTYAVTNILAAASTHTVSLAFTDNSSPPDQLGTNWSFTVINYATLPAGAAQTAATVPTSAPGFKMRISQYDDMTIINNDGTPIGTLPGSVAHAEAQLAGVLLDPMTKQPFTDDTTTPGPLADGYDGQDQGNFTSANGYPKATLPGVSGTDEDNLAIELVTYLHLSPGIYEFGCNCADGFRVTMGTNAYDALNPQIGIYDARGIPLDTTFELYVTQTGYYPCRIVWFRQSPMPDNSGNAGLEFYSVTPAGQKILVNDTSNPNAVLAYQGSTAPVAPYVKYAGPTAFISDFRGNDFGMPNVVVQLQDGTTAKVDPASVKLTVDGAQVAASVTNNSGLTTVSYTPPGLQLKRTVHNGQVAFQAGGTNYSKTWQFNSLRNYVLSNPIYFEDFEAAPHGGLPTGWTQTNYTTHLTAGIDFTDPNSDAFLGWTVVNTGDGSGFGDWDDRLHVGLFQELNGKFFDATTNALMVNQFLYAESDNRSGQQIQYVNTPFYNLSNQTGIVVAFDSAYAQNQNSIDFLEYTLDEGKTWQPLLYLLMGETDNQQAAQMIYDANGMVNVAATMAFPISPRYTNSLGKVIGGSVGAFIGPPISQALDPFIEDRVNDDLYESARFEAYRVPNADNQPSVQFRFAQVGTGSWYWGIDNWGIYSVPSLVTSAGPGALAIQLKATNVALTWTAASNVQLQQNSSLSTTNWTNVSGTLGVGSYTAPAAGTTFYRLIQQ